MRSIVLVALALTGSPAWAAGYPEFEAPTLKLGRGIWLGTCQACHGNSMADAPQVKDKAAWAPRIAKGVAQLYESALQGRTGKGGEEMPPRGGNAQLSDAEVKAAVDYMIELATH